MTRDDHLVGRQREDAERMWRQFIKQCLETTLSAEDLRAVYMRSIVEDLVE
jgi:hypothetical protein